MERIIKEIQTVMNSNSYKAPEVGTVSFAIRQLVAASPDVFHGDTEGVGSTNALEPLTYDANSYDWD